MYKIPQKVLEILPTVLGTLVVFFYIYSRGQTITKAESIM